MPELDHTCPSPGHVELNLALHWRMRPPFALDAVSTEQQIELLAQCIGSQVRSAADVLETEPFELVVVTTQLSGMVQGQPANAEAFLDTIEGSCGHRPLAILNPYMCVGWGYALRFFSNNTGARRLAVVIADVDLHNLHYYVCPPVVGASGFGISTLLFTLPDDRQETAETGGPYRDNAFKEMIWAIRARHAKRGRTYTFAPYLNGEIGDMIKRVLGPADMLSPNRNAELGHCFGSDPFIGIIDYVQAERLTEPRLVTVGAIAINGYYAVCTLALQPDTQVGFSESDADVSSLRSEIRGRRRRAASRLTPSTTPAGIA